MRLLAVLFVGAIMYVAVPLLWQHAILTQVNEISANQANFPVGNAIEVDWNASANLVNAVNGPYINEEEMNHFEQVGAEHAADDAMRQAQAASDRAWAATH